jgi:hypothetical protein
MLHFVDIDGIVGLLKFNCYKTQRIRTIIDRVCRGRERILVEYYNYLRNQCLSPLQV